MTLQQLSGNAEERKSMLSQYLEKKALARKVTLEERKAAIAQRFAVKSEVKKIPLNDKNV